MENSSHKRRPVRKRIESVFGKNLRRVLEERELTFRQAAKLCGVSPAVLHAWSQGGAPQDLGAVLKLCESLRVDFQWILTGTHPAAKAPLSLSEFFEIERDHRISGIFMIDARRLVRKDVGAP